MSLNPSSRLPYGASPPDSWNVIPLKYLVRLSNGFVFKSETWTETGTPILRIENLNGSDNFNYSQADPGERYHVTQGDLLFSWSGNPGTSFGPFRWNKSGRHFLNQHIFKVSVHGCDADWLYWALKAATHWIERELTSGMIGMVHVTKDELGMTPIPIPPLEEQRRIAAFLDAELNHTNSLARRRSRQIQLLDLRLSSWLTEIQHKLIDEFGRVRLRHLIQSIEQGWSPQCEDRPTADGEWGVVKAGCVNSGTFDRSQHKALPSHITPRLDYRLRSGDILVSRASGSPDLIGSTAVVEDESTNLLLCDKIYRLKIDNNRTAPWFIAFMLRSHPVREHIKNGISGADGMANNLPTSAVKDCIIPNAPLSKQREAVKEIVAAQAATKSARSALVRADQFLRQRHQALITAAVTGQFDVSTGGRGVAEGVSS
ncbi:restriction endonuclease subunit S [Micromonospora sp. NPDC049903]|uniref:restriction endonuclease subunit S n=1 Tax=Micromonospora sp. NPDC049903 TaxID=3364276 RepID=UPI0037A1521F